MATTATIKGTFLYPDGTARNGGIVVFKSLSTPFVETNDVISTKIDAHTLDANGKLNGNTGIPMVTGYYKVVVDNTDGFIINVPNDGGTYEVAAIITKSLTATVGGGNVVSASDVSGTIVSSTTIVTSQGGDRNAARNRFCLIGNYGSAGANAAAVASMVANLAPANIITTGNNNYPDGDSGDIDDNVGQYYADYIGDYGGGYGDGADTNAFWPAPGYVDWGAGGSPSLAGYLAYFTLPTNGNSERYYRQVLGDHVEIFVLDSSQNESDGYTQGSTQGAWLQAALSNSTKRWKFVVFWDAITGSVDAYSDATWMEWPFATWGAHAVFMGGPRIYERLLIDGIPYFIVGNGGQGLDTVGTPVAESQDQESVYGTLVLDVNEYSVKTYMVDVDGTVYDETEITNNTQNKVVQDIKVKCGGGLEATSDGLAVARSGSKLDLPVAEYEQTSEFGSVVVGQSEPDTVANPYYEKCIWIKNYDPPLIYVFNKHSRQWVKYTDPDVTTPYDAGYNQLATPTISPDGGNSKSFTLSHIDGDAILYYSVNGAAFSTYSSKVFFTTAHGRHPTVAARAEKGGYRSSDVVYKQFSDCGA